jgi:hypothetical protein
MPSLISMESMKRSDLSVTSRMARESLVSGLVEFLLLNCQGSWYDGSIRERGARDSSRLVYGCKVYKGKAEKETLVNVMAK